MAANIALFSVPMIEVIDRFSPHFGRNPPGWGKLPVTHDVILQAVKENALQSAPAMFCPLVLKDAVEKRDWHAGRIACLMKHGWGDEPILVSLQMTDCVGVIAIHDGHHRLWAAVMRGDLLLIMEIAGNARAFKEWWNSPG
jgi:hypothetical protein